MSAVFSRRCSRCVGYGVGGGAVRKNVLSGGLLKWAMCTPKVCHFELAYTKFRALTLTGSRGGLNGRGCHYFIKSILRAPILRPTVQSVCNVLINHTFLTPTLAFINGENSVHTVLTVL